MKTVLLVNHHERKCGVFQYGDILGNALVSYGQDVKWKYIKIQTVDQYWNAISRIIPDAVVFNYHPATLSLAFNVVDMTQVPTFGIVHENSWFDSDAFLAHFDYLISPDITIRAEVYSRKIFSTNRVIPDFDSHTHYNPPEEFVIGSFGFAFGGKGYERVVDKVQEEFDEAIIRLHIPFARFGDEWGVNAKYTEDACRERITKPGLKLRVSHEFLSRKSLIHWLELNTVNCFFYDSYEGRGISSTIDFALAARRPIAITDSNMFRHLQLNQLIRIEHSSLKEIISHGVEPLEQYYGWTEKNIAKEYEKIMEEVLA